MSQMEAHEGSQENGIRKDFSPTCRLRNRLGFPPSSIHSPLVVRCALAKSFNDIAIACMLYQPRQSKIQPLRYEQYSIANEWPRKRLPIDSITRRHQGASRRSVIAFGASGFIPFVTLSDWYIQRLRLPRNIFSEFSL